MQVQVARVGKPHGIRGEVTVQVMTDAPENRFVAGALLQVEPADRGPLTIRSARWNKDILLLGFDGITDRNQAETLRGSKLFIDAEEVDDDEEDAWYEHELVGLKAQVAAGDGFDVVGTVTALRLLPAQDLLVVENAAGEEILVPFVAEIVPEVHVEDGYVLLDPPGGLFELNSEGDDGGNGADAVEDGADGGNAEEDGEARPQGSGS